jgi:hypothetical protein
MTPPIPARPRVLSVVSEHFRTLPNGDAQHRITRIHATFYDPIDTDLIIWVPRGRPPEPLLSELASTALLEETT